MACMVLHSIPPIYDPSSHILLLGSFPSVRSREDQFFYAHPQNRFWRVLASVFSRPVPMTKSEKIDLLTDGHIALWDVVAKCEIQGSQDSSIRDVEANDLTDIFRTCAIEKIYVNGRTAEKLYQKYMFPATKRPAQYLPSTSPANASVSFDALVKAWSCLLQ
ncbi:MAG: DNA-deoxyinosine glycosylase [Clostridiales bacterium]|nr:DNA-deoxyinosine glycosylase [Clostridiales bacterium]